MFLFAVYGGPAYVDCYYYCLDDYTLYGRKTVNFRDMRSVLIMNYYSLDLLEILGIFSADYIYFFFGYCCEISWVSL